MGKIWTVINEKGGVGKTSLVGAIGAGLISKGYKVLLIDLDQQQNLSYSQQADSENLTIWECLNSWELTKKAIQTTPEGDIIPGSSSLATANNKLVTRGSFLKEYRLKRVIEQIKSDYDYIIIDTPPALGILTVNALAATDYCIVPVQASIYSILGFRNLYDNLQAVKNARNEKLTILGLVLNNYNSRSRLNQDVNEYLTDTAEVCDTVVLKAKIRTCTAIAEAQVKRTNIFNYAPKSNASKDYKAVIDELLEREAILENGKG